MMSSCIMTRVITCSNGFPSAWSRECGEWRRLSDSPDGLRRRHPSPQIRRERPFGVAPGASLTGVRARLLLSCRLSLRCFPSREVVLQLHCRLHSASTRAYAGMIRWCAMEVPDRPPVPLPMGEIPEGRKVRRNPPGRARGSEQTASDRRWRCRIMPECYG